MANTRKIFRDNLFYFLSKTGEQQTDICNLLDVSSSTVSSWVSADKMPRIEKIELLAEHYGVTVSDLLSPRNTKKRIPVKSVQHLLGHADYSTTMNIYVHWERQSLEDARSLMENFIAKEKTSV